MAVWKKVIVSGSVAELSAVSASAFYVQDGQLITTSPSTTKLSGSFSGSFSGNGSGLTNVALDSAITNGKGITAFSYNGTGSATVVISGSSALSADRIAKWTGDAFADTTLTDNGTVVSGASSIQLTGTDSQLTGSFTGSFKGDGSNLTGVVSTLLISASTAGGILSSGSVDLKTETLKINGTANEIDTDYNDTTNTLTVGLPDSVSITTDLTVGGNLTVNGDLTYLNVQNLAVEDKFILLNSGSTNPDEAGLVVDEGNGIGHAFAFDGGTTRWGFTASLNSNTSSFVPDAFAAAVVTSDIVEYQKTGNIRVESGEIYIWV
jgi:hypothetical protein